MYSHKSNPLIVSCHLPNISIQFLPFFYFLFLLTPIAIFYTQKIYFAYVVVIFYLLFYIFSLRTVYLISILSYSKFLFLLFIVINISLFWTTNLGDTLLYLAIFDHIPIIYLCLSITIIFSSTLQRSAVFVYISLLCFLINVALLLEFGTVRAYHHDMREIVKSYSNYMSTMMEVCLPMLFYRLKCKSTKYITIFAIILTLFNIVVSESRGGVLTLVLFSILLPIFYFRSKTNRIITFGLILIIILSGAISIFQFGIYEKLEVLERFSEFEGIRGIVSSSDPSDLSARLLMYHHGISLIMAHPLLGIGWGSFLSSMENTFGVGVIPHNFIIEIWSSSGIFGVGLLMLTLYVAFGRLYRHYQLNINIDRSISYWCLANIMCLVLLCFQGLFRPFLTNILLYFPLAEAFVFTRIEHTKN